MLGRLWYNDPSQKACQLMVFHAKRTPGEVAAPRGFFCAYLPLTTSHQAVILKIERALPVDGWPLSNRRAGELRAVTSFCYVPG